jgi:hypothetical protein
MTIIMDTVYPLKFYQTCHFKHWICFHHQV